ncbi:MAG TPA: S8 family serine peptidase [Steroidobacteraceae bacterium]|jgi:subtilisin family serine protease|nr:S8 family serine peptidase [Steroidobacteraceae bacterium]
MKRALPVAALALLISLLVTACALTRPLQAPPVPAQVRTGAGRYIVVTLRNEPRAEAEHPGSTPRGYDAAGRYGVTGSASRQAKALERDYGLRQISAWPIATLHVHCIMFQLPGAATRAIMIAQLSNDRRVESVQPLNEFTTESLPEALRAVPAAEPVQVPYNDPYAKLQVSLRELAVVPAQRHSRGAGVQVAVIDTGVDFDHPDLKGRVNGRRNFVDADDAKFRRDLHGTEVSGVIAAVADNGIGIVGIAPDARIIALKACWQAAGGGAAVCNSFTLAQALEAAIVAHADIVNMSLAGPPDPLLARLVSVGAAQGTIFVGAAGRAGSGNTFPADLSAVLAVDAAEDSSGNALHLLAPGRDILTLVPGGHYDFASGSSLAAAQISGIVALMLAEHPHLSVTEVRNLLLRSSRRVNSPAGEILVVDACAALTDARGRGSCGAAAPTGTTVATQ